MHIYYRVCGRTGLVTEIDKKERENAMNHRIFIVEDDPSISSMVRDYLFGEEFQTDVFDTGGAAVNAFADGCCELALIDLMLPDMSGLEVIKAIRKVSTVPIIIITAKDSDADKLMGLNLGADDYVVKPFSLIELTARIRANIRRAVRYDRIQGDDIVCIRDIEINVTKHMARIAGKELELTRTEFEILYLMASNPGQAFSKERLYDLVWKEPYFGNENVLNTHINRLRSKLKAASQSEIPYIKTLWGIGYKMEEE